MREAHPVRGSTIHGVINQAQLGWSRDRAPIVSVGSGAELTLALPEPSGGQIGPDSGLDAVVSLDFDRVTPSWGRIRVEGDGALLGMGDAHAAQGDSEICGSAIETPMTATVRVSVRRDLSIETREFDVVRPLERAGAAGAGYHGTTGVGPDLMEAARQAAERMIAHLTARHRLSPEDPSVPCSVAVHPQVSEVVGPPNWGVPAFVPGH